MLLLFKGASWMLMPRLQRACDARSNMCRRALLRQRTGSARRRIPTIVIRRPSLMGGWAHAARDDGCCDTPSAGFRNFKRKTVENWVGVGLSVMVVCKKMTFVAGCQIPVKTGSTLIENSSILVQMRSH